MNMYVSLITLAAFSWHSIPKQNNMHVSPIKKTSVRLRQKETYLKHPHLISPCQAEGLTLGTWETRKHYVLSKRGSLPGTGVTTALPLHIRIAIPIKKNVLFSPQTEFLAVLIFNMLSLCALLFYNMQRTSQGVALAVKRAAHARFLRVHIFRKKQLKRHRFRVLSEAHPLFISPCQGETRTHTECVRRRGQFSTSTKVQIKNSALVSLYDIKSKNPHQYLLQFQKDG